MERAVAPLVTWPLDENRVASVLERQRLIEISGRAVPFGPLTVTAVDVADGQMLTSVGTVIGLVQSVT